jgi:hypothetical protein
VHTWELTIDDERNPFVRSALRICSEFIPDEGGPQCPNEDVLAELLAELEPVLSPHNRGCVARAALRQIAAHEARAALHASWRPPTREELMAAGEVLEDDDEDEADDDPLGDFISSL